MAQRTLSAGLLLAAVLAACSSSSDPDACIREAERAFRAGDFDKACAKYTEAVRCLQRSDARFVDASLGLVEALIDEDPERAGRQFIELAESFPKLIGEKEFADFAGWLVNSRKYPEAVDVLEEGKQRFGAESQRLNDQLERVKSEAAANAPVLGTVKAIDCWSHYNSR